MRRHSFVRGFSLIELLTVIVIIGVLVSLVAVAIGPLLTGSGLSQSCINVTGILSYARQAAVSGNQIIEVRVYQYADPTFSGETAGSPNTGKYRAFQTFKINESNIALALTTVQRLPQGIIVDSGAQLTSIFCSTPTSGSSTGVAIPGVGNAYNYQFFRIRPSGSIVFFTTAATPPALPTPTFAAPTPPGTWCLTLHASNLGDGLATPPKNFGTIQIDSSSGSTSMFRP